MRSPRTAAVSASRADRGAALLFAIALVALLAVLSVFVIRYTGRDRIASAKMVAEGRGVACAEAGLQYGRKLFGSATTYLASRGWNEILSRQPDWPGRHDPSLDAPLEDLGDLPALLTGNGEAGTDLDGDGRPDFWVSIRDDDDERPEGRDDDRTHDNNRMIIVRSECINPNFATSVGGRLYPTVVETLVVHVQVRSDYGHAQKDTNWSDASVADQ